MQTKYKLYRGDPFNDFLVQKPKKDNIIPDNRMEVSKGKVLTKKQRQLRKRKNKLKKLA